ncbi:hypothetical protein C3747_104g141 [Trypanosoma cruzi]|uniref:Uncharacterized protein n=1 Tax=Trypanosoma cruzi TaxID=5693 RepID=A0A2V2WEX0_TRYCR|nr:hypothetical protein C3747_104g141 [Trypanosoma cruzi]
MENTRRKEPPLWLNPAVHVWITKNDIPVVNLRDISEKLRLPRSAFRADEAPQTPDEESCPAESASSNGEKTPEPTKTESLNALLGIAQRRSEKQTTPPTQLLAVPSNPPASGGSGASKDLKPKHHHFPKRSLRPLWMLNLFRALIYRREKYGYTCSTSARWCTECCAVSRSRLGRGWIILRYRLPCTKRRGKN